MSLVAQMERDREKGKPGGSQSDLPLFAAAEAIAASKRKRLPLLLVLPSVAIVSTLLAAPVIISKYFAQPVVGIMQPLAADAAPMPVIEAPPAKEVPHAIADAGTLPATEAIAAIETIAKAEVQTVPASASSRPLSIAEKTDQSKGGAEGSVKLPIAAAAVPAKARRVEVAAKLHSASPGRERKTSARHSSDRTSGVADFKRTVPLTPEQRDRALTVRASDLVARGAADAAVSLLLSELEHNAALPDSAALLASIYVERREFSSAEALVDRFDQVFPGRASLAVVRLRMLLARSDFSAALAQLRSLPTELQDRVDVMEMQASALHSLGDYRSASYYYRQLLSRDDTNARWWMGMAVALDAAAESGEARRAYTRALELRGLGASLDQYARQRLAQL